MTPQEFRAARLRLGLGTPRMARVLGVAQLTICRWENGSSPISEGVAARLEAILADPEHARADNPAAWVDGRSANMARARTMRAQR